MTSFFKRLALASVAVPTVSLISSSPLLADFAGFGYGYGYGYGYDQTVQAVVDDQMYTDGAGGTKQAFLIAEYSDLSLSKVSDYTLQIYDTEGLRLERSVALRETGGVFPSLLFDLLGVEKESTMFGLVEDINGNGVDEIRVAFYSEDTFGFFDNDALLESTMIFDGETGELLGSNFPQPGIPSEVKATLATEDLDTTIKPNGSLLVTYSETVTNNLGERQKVRVSTVIEKPDGSYDAGPRKMYKLDAYEELTLDRKFRLKPHFPAGEYKVIMTISSEQQAPYMQAVTVYK